ncbi:SDR family oxidoreductase [Amycolatopsis vancoresmycina]|uniref:Short chain dehydrogenase n=1 Tax=Amycolatopsis vancoresmycina DSM 44592 TaxID=1292037 RepID=R1HYV6_9PSEU|nr:SDR family oxidoreductase [Amycolatopsis vancoresmycina]EOD68720.1 short chain dehydrogenase [Amycolatopsis vancoresmycina DSM 44592]
MTTYFVTGATGFIGKRLVARLLQRPETSAVYALVRETSRERLATTARDWPAADKLHPVVGDLAEPRLGIDPADLDHLDHVVHLAALYDLTAGEEANRRANVEGTRHLLAFAAEARAGLVHHVSSIAVAGDHAGRFTEADFDLGQRFASPYHATKFQSEKLVREQHLPYRVYRPSAVVGDSRTGEMDKVDGPYYFLPAISRLAALPRRLPLAAPGLGATNLVPVDYVVEAMDHLMHRDAPSGTTYHLAAARPQPLNSVYNAFARAAGGPLVRAVLPEKPSGAVKRVGGRLAHAAAAGIDRVPGGRGARAAVLEELGVPLAVLPHLTMDVVFDTARTRTALLGSGVELPELRDYAAPLYRYWQAHLDPDRARRGPGLAGRTVLITGASSGIGRASALAVAAKGAKVILVARRASELEEVRAEILAAGGAAAAHPCDLTDGDAVDALVKEVLGDHGAVDMLVNNAGRSIRRSVALSTQRFHDFERTMAINYFGPVRLILGFLPSMAVRRFGHVVNVTTQGLQTDTPRFSAYLASKAALEEFGLTAGRETLSDGITFTSVRMPLVRTPMIAPTGYRGIPSSSPERAAALVVKALEERPEILSLPEGRAAELATLAAPRLARFAAHLAYRAMPESAPEARGLPRRSAPASVAAAVTRLIWRRRA